MQIVGERLRALREAMKMTQSQVGELLGVPQTSVFRYENPSIPNARIAISLGLCYNELNAKLRLIHF